MKTLKFASITAYSLTGLVLLGYTTSAHAGVVVIGPNIPAPQQNVPAVDSFQTDGNEMAGMAVTAFFSAAAPETVEWMDGGGTMGFAVGVLNNWRLQEDGDTWDQPWTLTYEGGSGLLTGFRIDGFAAGTGIGVMFDRTLPSPGTPSSAKGRDFEFFGPMPPFDALVRYEGAVGVASNDPVGDEYRWLDVRFVDFGGGDPSETLTTPPPPVGLDGVNLRTLAFRQDTNSPVIPEPASAALAVVALICLSVAIPHCRRRFDRG